MESALEQVTSPSFTEVDVPGITTMCFTDSLSEARFRFWYGYDSGDTILNSAVSDLVSSVGAIFPREIQVDL